MPAPGPRSIEPRRRWLHRIGAASAAAMVLGLALTPPARSSGRQDHDRAREAVRTGEVLPLPAVLERLQRTHPGQVLEVELEREATRWLYEIKLLQSNGQLLKLKLDARTAQILSVRQKDDRRTSRRDRSGEDTGR